MARSNPILDEKMICRMEMKYAPTTAPLHRSNQNSNLVKTVSMKFYTGDLFARNPTSHLYVMCDGYIDSSQKIRSLLGRGIAIGDTPIGFGIAFEHFGATPFMLGECVPVTFLDYEFYDIEIQTNKKSVGYKISGPNFSISRAMDFSDSYPSFDTVTGVANDKNPSLYGFFNMKQTMRQYWR